MTSHPNRRALLFTGGAALMALMASNAHPANLPMDEKGIKGPKARDDLIVRLRASLAKDASGKRPYEGGAGAYSPLAFYELVRTTHPEVELKPNPDKNDFESFLAWLRSLEYVPLAKAGMYMNSRRKPRANGSYYTDTSLIMSLPKGTMVWKDRNTGTVVLKANCANVLRAVEAVKKPHCMVINFEVRDEDIAQWDYDGPLNTDNCGGYRKVSAPGDVNVAGEPWKDLPVGVCEEYACLSTNLHDDLQRLRPYAGDHTTGGSFRVTPGHWQIMMSPGAALDRRIVMSICLKKKNGETGGVIGSNTGSVGYDSYGNGQARIFYRASQVPSGSRTSERGEGPRDAFFYDD